jgi:hypothetical protein
MGTLEMAAPKQHDIGIDFSTEEATMAKGHNRSGREPKKPKAEKPKPAATSTSFFEREA